MRHQSKKRLATLVASTLVVGAIPLQAEIQQQEIPNLNSSIFGGEIATGPAIDIEPGVPAIKPIDINMRVATQSALQFNPIIFGNSIDTANNEVVVDEATGNITIKSLGNKGKVSGTIDGIAFHYVELPATQDFEISVKAKVKSFTNNPQVSFGLMVRDAIGENGVANTGTDSPASSKMLGVGGLESVVENFVRKTQGGDYRNNAKYIFSNQLPKANNTYDLTIRKSGDYYEFTVDGKSYVDKYDNLFQDKMYVGIYAARATEVEYSDLSLEKIDTVGSLNIKSLPKLEYFLNQPLDLSGLVVSADGQVVSNDELMVYGFDGTQLGTQTITLAYAGAKTSFDITVSQLTCTALEPIVTPAKTTYYLGDTFDSSGLRVKATFNTGEVRELTKEEYILSQPNMEQSGRQTVTITYKDNDNAIGAPDSGTSFDIEVLADILTGVEITKEPIKTVYYLGEELDNRGMVVKAVYGDIKVLLDAKEYTIDATHFDTLTAGDKSITISYKGQTATLPLEVKEKTAIGIEVTQLPKTTYTVGEALDVDALEVSTVYDSGEKQVLTSSGYQLDTSTFNSQKAGVYTMTITPNNTELSPITFDVSVREAQQYEWNFTYFGQSVSTAKNYIEYKKDENGELVLDSNGQPIVRIVALEGGGKVTNSYQDGITYYYTELDNAKDNFELSADIKVEAFAKPTPDNQEGFGIMARDAIGTMGDSSIFCSNIAAVGGYRGNTKMFMRAGVTASDASGAATGRQVEDVLDETRPTSSNTYPAKTYRLTLRKTNSGYEGELNNGSKVVKSFHYEPDAMGIQDDKLYVGFYAARLATIEVSNVNFKVTDAATDAPKVEKPQEAIAPSMNIVSLTSSALEDYDLKVTSNANGTVTIKQGETIIARDKEVKAGEVLVQNTKLTEGTTTPFTVTFTPDTAQNLTGYDKIIKTHFVTYKNYQVNGPSIYVSPTGTASGDGSKTNPIDVQTAIDFARPGQTIVMLEGTYKPTSPIVISPDNKGTAQSLKALIAEPGKKVIIDGSNVKLGAYDATLNVDSDYWHVYGLEVTNSPMTGIRVGGNHNTVELCTTVANKNTGLQISRYVGAGGYDEWPSYNMILNCTSYDNKDDSENNADGFAAKLTVGDGNVFKGCIAHNNIDDAWDLYSKAATGPIGAVLLEDCIAYDTGRLTNGYEGKGDGNGFKLGGEGIAVKHTIKNSISFNNNTNGFDSNSNPAVISENCVSYDNGGKNFSWGVYTNVTPQFKATGNVSYRSTPGQKDTFPTELASVDNFYYDGTKSANSKGVVLTDANFKSLVAPENGYERDAQGNIIFGDFLSFISPANPQPPVTPPTTDDNSSSSSGGSSSSNKNNVDTIIQDALNNGKAPAVSVDSNNKVVINTSTLDKVVDTGQSVAISGNGVTVSLNSHFINSNEVLGAKKPLEVGIVPASEKVAAAIKKHIEADSNLTQVQAALVDISVSAGEKLKGYFEPIEVTIDLSKAVVKEQGQLTLISYEVQADGSVKVVKLGGKYDPKTKTFTARISKPGTYGMVEAKELLKVNLTVGSNTAEVNDTNKVQDIAPQIIEGSTMVPLRFIAENLEAEVKWDGKLKEVTIIQGDEVLTLRVGKGSGQEAMIQNNRTLVPLRYISEQLGANVLWIPSAKAIEIVK